MSQSVLNVFFIYGFQEILVGHIQNLADCLSIIALTVLALTSLPTAHCSCAILYIKLKYYKISYFGLQSMKTDFNLGYLTFTISKRTAKLHGLNIVVVCRNLFMLQFYQYYEFTGRIISIKARKNKCVEKETCQYFFYLFFYIYYESVISNLACNHCIYKLNSLYFRKLNI